MKYSCKDICRYVMMGLLSHFGTMILIILYLIGGGYLFVKLEVQNEKLACETSFKLLEEKLNDTTYRAIAIVSAGQNATVYYDQLKSMLFNFSKDVFTLNVSPSKDCKTLGEGNNIPNWNLANSIFFCATIVTTIGYGNLYPVTTWGRIVCIIYAFVGIPLMLLFLGNFGEVLASVFRSAYLNFCCFQCFIHRKIVSEKNKEVMQNDDYNIQLENGSQLNLKPVPPPKMVKTDNTDLMEIVEDDSNMDIPIPLIIVISFLLLYMYVGAALFRIWESWDLVAGLYFAFITVSTIGFGDLYPAKETIGSSAATLELIVGAIYCVIGLAILSMCLTLVKDEIVGKFIWFGEKFGIGKQNNNDIETEEYNPYEDQTGVVRIPQSMRAVRHSNDAFEQAPEFNNSTLKMKSA